MLRLVYYKTTDEPWRRSNNSRWKAKGINTPPICAVVDRLVGLRQLKPTEVQGGGHYKKLKVVCAAELHDDLMRQVRMWTRLRYGAGQVSFQWKNPDFLFKNPDFLLKNPDFLLRNDSFIIKIGTRRARRAVREPA